MFRYARTTPDSTTLQLEEGNVYLVAGDSRFLAVFKENFNDTNNFVEEINQAYESYEGYDQKLDTTLRTSRE